MDFLIRSNFSMFRSCNSTCTQNMVPGLYDPLGFSKNKSEEALARGRDVEIKNGRLAMIGVAGLYAAATIEGSVPMQPPC